MTHEQIKELVAHFKREIDSQKTDLFVLPTSDLKALLDYIERTLNQ